MKPCFERPNLISPQPSQRLNHSRPNLSFLALMPSPILAPYPLPQSPHRRDSIFDYTHKPLCQDRRGRPPCPQAPLSRSATPPSTATDSSGPRPKKSRLKSLHDRAISTDSSGVLGLTF
ncbi:hypothetical protein AAC387_Pa08g1392 [Persea americana]